MKNQLKKVYVANQIIFATDIKAIILIKQHYSVPLKHSQCHKGRRLKWIYLGTFLSLENVQLLHGCCVSYHYYPVRMGKELPGRGVYDTHP